MKQAPAIFAVLLGGLSAVAGSFALPPQGASPYADTEMSTNIVFGTSDGGRLRKAFDLALSLAGTPSNCLQVAFGRDADGNGVLDPSETDTVYGWRAGRYFVEDARGWRRVLSGPVPVGGECGLRVHVEAYGDYRPRRISLECGGDAAFSGLANERPDWLLRRGWNLARVTRRGVDVPSGWVECRLSSCGLALSVR